MKHTTNDPYFPKNLEDYAPWVAKYGLTAPYGECQCGCGQKTRISQGTASKWGYLKGHPRRFVINHNSRRTYDDPGPNPSGLCMCGCGQQTNIADKSHTKSGTVKDKPRRYIKGHGGRKPFVPFDKPHMPPNAIAVELTQGKITILDDCDADLTEHAWSVTPAGERWYARRTIGHRGSTVMLHRIIAERMGIDLDQFIVDHANGDSLDNRRSNLRAATPSQNMYNSAKPGNNKSGYKGVCWHKRDKCWMAYCNRRHLGYFDSAIEAAKAYNEAAIRMFGEFAKLNVIE